ncbi:MAG: uridylate kinase [candidate division Zixibacteria bacterium SM23_73_3]|nr:MAG: uridylate kinase [candidate division Zixibacteria bacterium SM23_73_3]
MGTPIYKRILLKISGESLARDKEGVIDPDAIAFLSKEIKSAKDLGVQLATVVGGGNIIRGQISSLGAIDRVSADYMGMLATIINSLALQDSLENFGLSAQVMSAIHIDTLTQPYMKREALRHLKRGSVIILAGGTGNSYFTTDTTAALRATEIGADVVMKGTKVDGVYDDDPMKNSSAQMFDTLSYMEVLNRKLKVMDLTAISLCMENKLPIIVFNLLKEGNLKRILLGEKIGTKVSE